MASEAAPAMQLCSQFQRFCSVGRSKKSENGVYPQNCHYKGENDDELRPLRGSLRQKSNSCGSIEAACLRSGKQLQLHCHVPFSGLSEVGLDQPWVWGASSFP